MLNTVSHGTPHPDRPPLLIAHGLFGSARNWGRIAQALSDERQVVAVDMRNHGHSPRTRDHDYPGMAADLAEVIETLGGQADVLGHSMGGKAAMVLALTRPDTLRRLVVADIAPVAYTHSQMPYVKAMQAVDLSRVSRRSDAAAQLAENGVDPDLQSFFTQSLDLRDGRWLINLDTLAAEMPRIMGFPELDAQWPGPALFLTGERSDYVKQTDRARIRALFPAARFARLKEAGHWLHADQPVAFADTVRGFLGA